MSEDAETTETPTHNSEAVQKVPARRTPWQIPRRSHIAPGEPHWLTTWKPVEARHDQARCRGGSVYVGPKRLVFMVTLELGVELMNKARIYESRRKRRVKQERSAGTGDDNETDRPSWTRNTSELIAQPLMDMPIQRMSDEKKAAFARWFQSYGERK
jgi:hypothetical protein